MFKRKFGDRLAVPDIIVLLTTQDPSDDALTEAQNTINQGINIIIVAIGPTVRVINF